MKKKLYLIWQIILGNYEPITKPPQAIPIVMDELKQYTVLKLYSDVILTEQEADVLERIGKSQEIIMRKIKTNFILSDEFEKSIAIEDWYKSKDSTTRIKAKLLILVDKDQHGKA